MGEVAEGVQRQPDIPRLGLRLPAFDLCLEEIEDRTWFEGKPDLAVVRLGQPVQVGNESSQPSHLLDDVVGGFVGRLQSVAHSSGFELYDAQGSVQLVGRRR